MAGRVTRWLEVLLVVVGMALWPVGAAAAGRATPTPTVTVTATATATAAATATATAQPARTATATATPTAQPTLTATAQATPTPTATLMPEGSAEPTAMPEGGGDATAHATFPSQAPAQSTPAAEATATPGATGQPEGAPVIADDQFSIWHGVVREGGAYRRAAPSGSAAVEEELDPGTPVRVDGWVAGAMMYPDVITWAAVDPADGGGYIFGGSLEGVLPPAVPPPPEPMANYPGDWIDVNLTLDVVTAYQDGQPVKMMLTSPGRPGYNTDTGLFSIRSRFTRQNMAGPGYFVPNVPTVQYFYGGEALHGRYWTLPDVVAGTSADVDQDGALQDYQPPAVVDNGGVNRGVAFGVPSSHGCLGLEVDDAAWLFAMGAIGVPVDVHYSQ